MILTGKTKEDFEIWLHSNDVLIKEGIYDDTYLTDVFEELPLNLQYASIIEWFDSVVVYINTTYEEYEDIQVKNFPVKIKTWSVWINELLLEGFNSRQDALTEAIKKANEIYNEKN